MLRRLWVWCRPSYRRARRAHGMTRRARRSAHAAIRERLREVS